MKPSTFRSLLALLSYGLVASSAAAETMVVGGRVANVYSVSEIDARLAEQERLRNSEECIRRKEAAKTITPRKGQQSQARGTDDVQDACGLPIEQFFVCRCQVYKHSFNNPNPVDTATGAIVLEDAGAWNPITLLLTMIALPIETSDLIRETKSAEARGCQSSWNHCKVNILFVQVPGKFAKARTLSGSVQRPVFRMLIDFTGEKNTFLDVAAKGASWYLDFSKKASVRPSGQ